MGEDTTEPPPPLDPHHRIIHVAAHGSISEDSDSSSSSSSSSSSNSSANTETPPPELGYSTVQSGHTHARTPRAISSRYTTGNTQKVHFSHSIERREGARRGGNRLTTAGSSAEQSGIEVGDISSGQLKLGLDAHAAGSRANVLATLYQNYLRDVNTAQPITRGTPKVATGESKKTRTTTESKLKSYPPRESKVHIWILCTYSPTMHV
jgi:hypothetical protein